MDSTRGGSPYSRTKLLKRFRKQGTADEGEANALVDEWKHAAKHTKRLHLGDGQHKRALIGAWKARAAAASARRRRAHAAVRSALAFLAGIANEPIASPDVFP